MLILNLFTYSHLDSPEFRRGSSGNPLLTSFMFTNFSIQTPFWLRVSTNRSPAKANVKNNLITPSGEIT